MKSNNTPFLRWLLIAVPITVMLVMSKYFGFYQDVYDYDKSFISFAILGLFLLQSLFVGYKTYTLDNSGSQFGWFMSDNCLTLGMIGTIVGFLMMLKGGFTLSSSDATGMQALLARFSVGLGTALYTTLVGLICSVLLKLQLFNLGHALGSIKDNE